MHNCLNKIGVQSARIQQIEHIYLNVLLQRYNNIQQKGRIYNTYIKYYSIAYFMF